MKSVPMSTYLVCFAVHKFGTVSRTSKRGVPVSSHLPTPTILDNPTFAACCSFENRPVKVFLSLKLTIYAQPSQLHTAEYAADVTKIIFDYFEEYFNMNYSISKLGRFHSTSSQFAPTKGLNRSLFPSDKIAIPDFGTGAMENWGLITYRETNLLYDPNESSSLNKQRVATVISHELVHQVHITHSSQLHPCCSQTCSSF